MLWCGMKRMEDTPKDISIPTTEGTNQSIEIFIEDTLGSFVKEYVLVEFDAEKKLIHNMEALKKKKTTDKQSTINETTSAVSSVTHTFVPGVPATTLTLRNKNAKF